MQVHKPLENGFLESVYQEALAREFVNRNIPFLTKYKIEVFYEDQKLNKFFVADFVCFEHIVLELKATSKPVGLLIHFGEKA